MEYRIYSRSSFSSIHATKDSFFFNLRSSRPPHLQVRPLRARQWCASLPVSESSGEPRLHEGGPEGEEAAVGGAQAQAFHRGGLPQTGLLTSKKKWQETLSACQILLLFLSGLDLLLLCLPDQLDWNVQIEHQCPCSLNPPLHPRPFLILMLHHPQSCCIYQTNTFTTPKGLPKRPTCPWWTDVSFSNQPIYLGEEQQ